MDLGYSFIVRKTCINPFALGYSFSAVGFSAYALFEVKDTL